MLQLKAITKDYTVADTKVHALRGVDLHFRPNEFVSILGPSGCGKTTLLNIVGGLDHYTTGDLLIDGVSTKNYTDRDWDTYRNYRIGFIFQSYNLIPHQTVLENVELALNISGVEKQERIARAKEALDKVGLKGQYNKRPNQLSGGQCQRVAIARALVNDPEILLADEPTGALDTETSEQIMDLIKEISQECLVIMVTHNPEIAEKYSTRIIRLLDGLVTSDSHPYDGREEQEKPVKKKKKEITKKSKLSFWSAFRLSARNLRSKFKRTALVCLAGSIGIVGIATVLAISAGVHAYIDNMQNDMLSGNPISVSEEALNINSMMLEMPTTTKKEAVKHSVKKGQIDVYSMVAYMISRSKDLTSLAVTNKITDEYIEYLTSMPKEYYAALATYYGIDVTNNIYTDFTFDKGSGEQTQNYSLAAALQIYTSLLNETEYRQFSSYIETLSSPLMQAPNNPDFILSQYDILSDPSTSKVATEANEIMIVVSSDHRLTDLTLAQLGYFTQKQFLNIINKAANSESYDESLLKNTFTYDELLGKTFTYYPNNTVYTPTGNGLTPFSYSPIAGEDWSSVGYDLKVTAILCPKKEISYGCLSSGFYYTEAFAHKYLADNMKSRIASYLRDTADPTATNPSFTCMEFNGVAQGITYKYDFSLDGTEHKNVTGFVGGMAQTSILGSLMGQSMPAYYTLSLRSLGGIDIPSQINIYPTDFTLKDSVTAYLDEWNGEKDLIIGGVTVRADERDEVIYNDMLSLVISVINTLIDMVTIALIIFTALSLVVSTVMIAIITYVSVIERVKEIGVIRSLGGRKRDVSFLFNAETFIIGGIAGVVGIVITYLLSAILNLIVGSLSGIYTIASLPVLTALLMIALSIVLTSISGIIPANIAAKKDPVDALRTE
ncbi:MAG: ABC transporter ATP-binding protein/permease [Clostridia bacterium]|nr:ABC transporter ATP-binding protein/permease [Clostridia bacterium]